MNLSGFNLAGLLAAKHFEHIGDEIAQTIAAKGPGVAVEVEREQRQKALQEAATKLAAARLRFDKEHADVIAVQKLIANDSNGVEALIAARQAGTVSEEAFNSFCDALEANKKRLPTEQAQEDAAKDFLLQVEATVDKLSKELADFDATAQSAVDDLASANAQKDLQTMRARDLAELNGMAGVSGASTALAALTRQAAKIHAEADGMKIVGDVAQKPLDKAAEVDKVRQLIAAGSAVAESPIDRLRRLAGTPAPAAA